jgi:hypothetical protein
MYPYDTQHCQLEILSNMYRDSQVMINGQIGTVTTGLNKTDRINDHPGMKYEILKKTNNHCRI